MPREVLSYIAWAAIGIGGGYVLLQLFWKALGAYKVRKAGPRPLFAARHRLWRDPGAVAGLDMTAGPGGREHLPVPPYRFLEEHSSGSQP